MLQRVAYAGREAQKSREDKNVNEERRTEDGGG
jgi:hypothetical protein